MVTVAMQGSFEAMQVMPLSILLAGNRRPFGTGVVNIRAEEDFQIIACCHVGVQRLVTFEGMPLVSDNAGLRISRDSGLVEHTQVIQLLEEIEAVL